MKRIAQILIVVIALLASACSTTRKTVAAKTETEAHLTAKAEQQHHAGTTEKATVITDITTDERRDVVIDFATVEFCPGTVPALPTDTAARRDWLNAVVAANTEGGEKAKPPNVKSITKGRAVISGQKNEQSRTESQADRTTAEDDTIKQDVRANHKEAADTKTEEKPKFTFWDWLYISLVVAACTVGIGFIIYVVRQIRKGN